MAQKRRYSPYGKKKKPSTDGALEIVRASRHEESRPESYREQSLRIHGLICAKCAREFGPGDRHLLTVHHRDGDRNHNPPDGSNWENLCAYCHEDEHDRGRLGDYLSSR